MSIVVMSSEAPMKNISDAIAEASPSVDWDKEFRQQLERYQAFKLKMDRAGIIPNKQEFSISLTERVGAAYSAQKNRNS